MIIAGEYSFSGGKEYIQQQYPYLLDEIYEVIRNVDARQHRTKESKEVRRNYQMLYSPSSLNTAFKTEFGTRGWINRRVSCEYPTKFYTPGYQTNVKMNGSFRDMDFVKEKLGVEVQFGKYSGSQPSEVHFSGLFLVGKVYAYLSSLGKAIFVHGVRCVCENADFQKFRTY
ncbi:BglII/BstYI family type II restriction endonuclease [Calothrix sp. UHCC 0171]|uniref:BglII/BstYI family type II restriction endonuclease n=1 Tax=Calothrix sp. UHCC 0171 TaxID=3110245 RepID=UPI002B2052FB|nr:BglII/BstYI family type II restriction endonuclease [Calothrix sp. UHCC 0171]MEA5572139.1 BglII/BstYI family type II restriction endonuclease [Calothrix sp. UHCC 0171]